MKHAVDEPWVRVARESREAVEVALRQRDLAPRVRARLEMVKGVALGHSGTRSLTSCGGVVVASERWCDGCRRSPREGVVRWQMRHAAGARCVPMSRTSRRWSR